MNGTSRQETIYWDSCIYIAWLIGETQHGKGCKDAIRQMAEDNASHKNVIISSIITYTEVLAINLTADNEALFRKSFRTQHHIAYDVDPPIALKAREIRERFLRRDDGKKIKTPDALHLATAIVHKAERFLTFDDGLLVLNGDARVDGLIISKPFVDQGLLSGVLN